MKEVYYPAQKVPLGLTEKFSNGVIKSVLSNGDGTVIIFLESGKELFYFHDQTIYCIEK